jgi:hypothetical protein
VSPWLFFFLSTIAFISSVCLAYFFLPDREEQAQINRYKELKKELAKTEKEIARIKQEGKQADKDHHDLTVISVSKIELGRSLENLIMTHGESDYKHYMNVNRRNRPNPSHPVSCFTDHYPFTWKTNFQYRNAQGGNHEKSIE